MNHSVWACIEKRIIICGQESYDNGGAEEKKERKTEAGAVGQHQERLVGEIIVRGGSARPSSMEASRKVDPTHKWGRMRKNKKYCNILLRSNVLCGGCYFANCPAILDWVYNSGYLIKTPV